MTIRHLVLALVVNELDRKPMGFFTVRDGNSFFSPIAGIYGPKVMLHHRIGGIGRRRSPVLFQT